VQRGEACHSDSSEVDEESESSYYEASKEVRLAESCGSDASIELCRHRLKRRGKTSPRRAPGINY